MILKLSKIDPTTASREEILREVDRLQQILHDKRNEEQAIKIFINSIYGATASPWFIGYNTRIAEAITLQGQHLNKYAIDITNRYFKEFWHKDKRLHKKLNINTDVGKVLSDAVVYGDTDSNYVSFNEMIKSCKWKGSGTDFIMKVYEHRLSEYITRSFEKYAEKSGTKNIQSFDLESISESAIILAKKKYALDIVWKDPGITYKPRTRITPVGIEIVQSQTPSFVRKVLHDLLVILFTEKTNLNIPKFVNKLKEYKEAFMVCNVEDISRSTSVSNYEKYITQDQEQLTIESRCPVHVRASGVYNYTLNNSKHKRKYHLIRSGDKIRWYFSKPGETGQNVFAFQPGEFPYEIAPEVDYDAQYAKTVIEPINRFMVAMGFGPIPLNLITATRLF